MKFTVGGWQVAAGSCSSEEAVQNINLREFNYRAMSKGVNDLIVYQKSYKRAMIIFKLTKAFPKEEKYSLTDQIRRSSRSVCSNIGEAYRKRIYPNHFRSKLTDVDSECTETMIWLDFSLDFGYVKEKVIKSFLTNMSKSEKCLAK